jgi:hypothetical protein
MAPLTAVEKRTSLCATAAVSFIKLLVQIPTELLAACTTAQALQHAMHMRFTTVQQAAAICSVKVS